MKKILTFINFFIIFIAMTVLFTGCSVVPKDPRMSLGKKCVINEDNNKVSSYIWVYGKEGGLSATKEQCNSWIEKN